MFRRKQKKEIELLSIAKRTEAAKSAPKTSSELKARRRAVRSMSFDHNPEQLQPLEEKKFSRKLSEPLLEDTDTSITYTPPPVQEASRADARLKLIDADSAQDTKNKPSTEVHTSSYTMKIVPNERTNGSRVKYRHSTYATRGGVPNAYLALFKNSHENLCEEEEDLQRLKFDDLPEVQRDRTSTENSMFDVSYEL